MVVSVRRGLTSALLVVLTRITLRVFFGRRVSKVVFCGFLFFLFFPFFSKTKTKAVDSHSLYRFTDLLLLPQ